MHKREQLPRSKPIDLQFCQHCLYGKQKRAIFLRTKHETKGNPFTLVYSDVFGPTKVASIGGANYIFIFLDDCPRKLWIYMLHNKSDVFSKFEVVKVLAENQIGHRIKCLQMDNSTKFCSLEIDSFCVDNDIHRIKIIPFTPQNIWSNRENE